MTGTVLESILALLIPLFIRGADGDQATARRAATQLLESLGPRTDHDLLLAAEMIGFRFASLDSLGQSVAEPDLSITTRLRLRSNANSLSRSANRNGQGLGKPERTQPEPATDPQEVRDVIEKAAPCIAPAPASVQQTLSRQQRRFLARKAEEARAAQEREARKAARLAERAERQPGAAANVSGPAGGSLAVAITIDQDAGRHATD